MYLPSLISLLKSRGFKLVQPSIFKNMLCHICLQFSFWLHPLEHSTLCVPHSWLFSQSQDPMLFTIDKLRVKFVVFRFSATSFHKHCEKYLLVIIEHIESQAKVICIRILFNTKNDYFMLTTHLSSSKVWKLVCLVKILVIDAVWWFILCFMFHAWQDVGLNLLLSFFVSAQDICIPQRPINQGY